MAFRKYLMDREQRLGRCTRENGDDETADEVLELKVVGLENAYHGDTLGAMDCVASSVFNAPLQAPWYRGRGVFLSPPYIAITAEAGGRWELVEQPQWLSQQQAVTLDCSWASLDEALETARTHSPLAHAYRRHINSVLHQHDRQHPTTAHLAALILEPLVQGAGGMKVIDPLFQSVLVQECRARHMPVIFDEVMTGLYRLGSKTAASLLNLSPDIACYAKLMTAGVVPAAATLTTEAVFNAFQGNSKLQALLHGHSYTAYPVGCASTIAALDILSSPIYNTNICSPSNNGLHSTCPTPKTCAGPCGRLQKLWDPSRVLAVAHHPLLAHVIAIGTIFAAKMRPPRAAATAAAAAAAATGYGSSVAAEVVTRLREARGIYARPLGDVVYLMVTPTTHRHKCDQLLVDLQAVLDELHNAPQHVRLDGRAAAQEIIV